ncbi:MAG TPA: hypothetical protein VI138_07780 [Candidatus Dormibacteraeota bacterium]
MTLRFRRQRRLSLLLTPELASDGRPVRRYTELRRDPLTGRSGRVAHFVGFELLPPDLDQAVTTSRANCPFCPERILKVTPRLDPAISGPGRIQVGEATLFPNISPYDRQSVVVVLTREHFVPGNRFTVAQLENGIQAAIEYFRALPDQRRGSHALLTWNYMPPAGATQVHAHLQAFATDRPGSLLEDEVRRSRTFWRRQGHSYWEELAEAEQASGDRFVARGRRTVWLTAFVSLSVVSDLLTLFPGRARLPDLAREEVSEFATGLAQALSTLHGEGVRAFNLALYSAPLGDPDPHFWLHARLSPRIYFNPAIQGSDATAWQHLLDEPFMVRSPEDLAERLRGGPTPISPASPPG